MRKKSVKPKTPTNYGKVPAKRIAAYTRASGKRVAAFKRKPRVKLNQFTGKPRRWTYGVSNGFGAVDHLFEIAEVFSSGIDSIPVKARKAIGKELRRLAGWLSAPKRPSGFVGLVEALIKRRMEEDQPDFMQNPHGLTDAELRYCELEGISPEDFAKTKANRGH